MSNKINLLETIKPLVQPSIIKHIQIGFTPTSWFEHRHEFPKERGIYMMFGYMDIYHCLRIGMAAGATGIFGRWFSSISSHYKSFQAPTKRLEAYHEFYRTMSIYFERVDIVFLLYPQHTAKEIRHLERELIKHHSPLWEHRTHNRLFWKGRT